MKYSEDNTKGRDSEPSQQAIGHSGYLPIETKEMHLLASRDKSIQILPLTMWLMASYLISCVLDSLPLKWNNNNYLIELMWELNKFKTQNA